MDNGAISDLLAGRNVRLVVLSACQSGKTSNKEAYADLASHLARKNIPAVVAMQYSILDLSATKFASIFYQALINKPVDLALTEARIVMKNAEKSNGVDFATPVLYLSDPDCLAVSRIKPEAPEIFSKPTMLGEVAVMKKGFVGRRRELRLLQKDFMSDVKRAAIIHGFGGIGKTVLATRLALRMNQYFEGMFAMRCKATTRPEDILNEINTFLLLAGIHQLNQVLCDTKFNLKTKTATLAGILNQRRFLVILDNFEDCLDETRSNIANPELKEFIQHVLNNTITNTKFIITTRYNFDPLERRLTGSIEHISLPELPFPETLWLMNNYKELANLETEKKRKIYKAIGGHPWTIGQFARHAAIETVDGVLLDLTPVKKELINFTLLDKSYSKLDERAKKLLLCASIYQEAVPVEALSWITGDESQPSPPVSEALEKLINWGLVAEQEAENEIFYAMHTMVKEFAEQELEKEKLDRKKLLIRAAQYYENLAERTRNLWDHLKAREYYYQAEEWEKADEIANIAQVYLERWGYIELAIKLLNQSIEITSGTRKAMAMGNLANMFFRLGDLKIATKLYTEVKEIFEKEREMKHVASVLHNLGAIQFQQGNYEEACKLYNQSLKIKEELGDKIDIAGTLHNLGYVHFQLCNYEEACKLYNQSLKIKEELSDEIGIVGTLHNLGMIYQRLCNYEEAIKLYQQSLEIAEKLGAKRDMVGSLFQLGTIQANQGNFEEAIKFYHQSLKIAEEIGDKKGITYLINQLGTIHRDQGNYEEAIKLYHQSLKIAEELGDKYGIAIALHNLGTIYQDQGNHEEAVKNYQQSMKIKEKIGDKSGIANTLHNLGIIHRDQGNYEESVKLFLQSLKIFEELGDKRGYAKTLRQLGRIREEKDKDYASALEKYLISLSIFKELNDPNSKIVENLIAELKEKMGEEAFNKAFEDIRSRHDA